jgi:hypothetical protein
MSEQIGVRGMGEHEYAVELRAGEGTTHHRVTVPPDLVADLAPDADEERLVRESFEFLLEREKATQILADFSLDVIPRYFPEYPDEIRSRLAV